ncbi:hypothetical protein L0F63_001784, partial [Massospora cicadina]
ERKNILVGQPTEVYSRLFTGILHSRNSANGVNSNLTNASTSKDRLPLQSKVINLRKSKADLDDKFLSFQKTVQAKHFSVYLNCIKFYTDHFFDQAIEDIEGTGEDGTGRMKQPFNAYDSTGLKLHNLNKQYGLHIIQTILDPKAKVMSFAMKHHFKVVALVC